MRNGITWLWRNGIASTFLTGLFALLPIVITVGIMLWAGGIVREWFGPGSWLGGILKSIGLRFAPENNENLGTIIGWLLVLIAIWLVGMFVKSFARYKTEEFFHNLLNRLPLVGAIYRPVSQVVGMLKKDDSAEMKSMSVIYCEFGMNGGGGFLALLAGNKVFRFGQRECYVVYIPTSPVPMSGATIFVPVEAVHPVDMEIDDLMQIYFSLGVMSEQVIPSRYEAVPPERP